MVNRILLKKHMEKMSKENKSNQIVKTDVVEGWLKELLTKKW